MIKTDQLRQHIYTVCSEYDRLTVRQLFYRLVSLYGYPNLPKFYKRMDWHLVQLRREDPELNAKFIDTTRALIEPPRAWDGAELWVEKDTIRTFLEDLAREYRVRLQMQRGFGSLTMYRDALERAVQEGVEKILYVGDFDPSGLCIESVTEREMELEIARIALTHEQAKGLPAQRVKRMDSRARKYIARYGDRCWEVEALDPKELRRIVEGTLQEIVPREHLREAGLRDNSAVIASDIIRPLYQRLQEEVYRLLLQELPEDEIKRRLAERFGLM